MHPIQAVYCTPEQIHLTFSHLADAFIQSDLQIRTKLKRVIVKRQKQFKKCLKYKVQAFLRVA